MKIEDVGERQIKAPARALSMSREDNVAVLLRAVKVGEAIMFNGARLEIATQDIPAGFTIAARPLAVGQTVINCGQVIGKALHAIRTCERVYHHNMGAL